MHQTHPPSTKPMDFSTELDYDNYDNEFIYQLLTDDSDDAFILLRYQCLCHQQAVRDMQKLAKAGCSLLQLLRLQKPIWQAPTGCKRGRLSTDRSWHLQWRLDQLP
jgi:hypothetical protein